MRPVIAFLTLAAFSLCPGAASAADATTLIFEFEQSHSDRVLSEVRAEIGNVMRNAGITFDLKLFSELGAAAEFSNLMVVRVKGKCKLDSGPAPRPEKGPLAFAHTSDGKVLPFIEVSCDRVRSVIRPVMWGSQFKIADELLGRALARVIAHEIYHVMTGTKHSDTGIARHSLTGSQLIGDDLMFEPEDIERMILSSAGTGGGTY